MEFIISIKAISLPSRHKLQLLKLYSNVVVFLCCCHMVQLKSSLIQQNRGAYGGLLCFEYGCNRFCNKDASQSIPPAQCHQFDQLWSQPPFKFLHYSIAAINLKAASRIKGGYLGFIFDKKLSFNSRVIQISRMAFFHFHHTLTIWYILCQQDPEELVLI